MSTQTHKMKHLRMRDNDSVERLSSKLNEYLPDMCLNSSLNFETKFIFQNNTEEFMQQQCFVNNAPGADSSSEAMKNVVGTTLTSKLKKTRASSTLPIQEKHIKSIAQPKELSEEASESASHNTSYDEFGFLATFDENMEEQSPQSPPQSAVESGKKNEKFKKPIMESADEELLLELGPKYKNDWKKISKRIFNLRNRRFNPKFLMARYKELVTDSSIKRVRFTHEEDLLIAKYFNKYGNDWSKIAIHFNSRTPTMLKNRYYSHIRKRNLLDELLSEADDESEKPLPEEIPMTQIFECEQDDHTNEFEEEIKSESDLETLHLFSQKNHKIRCKKIKIPLARLMFEINEFVDEEELCDKVTPLLN